MDERMEDEDEDDRRLFLGGDEDEKRKMKMWEEINIERRAKNAEGARTHARFRRSGTRYVSPAWWIDAIGNLNSFESYMF
jgi:hypothetical protein